jgi:hypothetical protein
VAEDRTSIIVEELKPARVNFSARLEDGRILVASARCPLLEAARVLLAKGVDPGTVLEMQHQGSAIVAMRGKLGKLAGLTVTENNKIGPTFAKYVPFDRAAIVDGRLSLQRLAQDGENELPGTLPPFEPDRISTRHAAVPTRVAPVPQNAETTIADAYRAALLRDAAQLPKRKRHQFLRQRLILIKREQAQHKDAQHGQHP